MILGASPPLTRYARWPGGLADATRLCRGTAQTPTRFLKKAGQKLSKIVRSTIFKKVFVKLFSKSLWGAGRSPAVLGVHAFVAD